MQPLDLILAICMLSFACAWWQEKMENKHLWAENKLRWKHQYEHNQGQDSELGAHARALDWHGKQIIAMQEVDTKLVDGYLQSKVDLGKTRMLVRRGLEEMSQ